MNEVAKNKIETIYNNLKNNASFEEQAKEFSNDRNSAHKGGELG